MSYLKRFGTRRVPQWAPLPGQAPNSDGGYAWAVDVWTRLRRFLILGSEKGSYYATEWSLTRENALAVEECVREDGPRAVAEIVRVSAEGRAPKNDPALFALALAAGLGDVETRRAALAALPQVARTGTHLLRFAVFVENTSHRQRNRRDPDTSLKIGDCMNTIALEFSLEDATYRENSLYKIDTLIGALARFRDALAAEAALRDNNDT